MESEQRAKRFGAAMAKARQKKGLSQHALGTEIGSNQSTISSWERGESEPPPDFVFAIERACDEPGGALSQLLGYTPVTEDTLSDLGERILMEPTLDAYRRDLLYDLFERMQQETIGTPPSEDSTTPEPKAEASLPQGPRSRRLVSGNTHQPVRARSDSRIIGYRTGGSVGS